MAEIAEKMYSPLILGGLVEKLIFQDGGGSQFGIKPKSPGLLRGTWGLNFL